MPSGANDRLALLTKAATEDETRGLLQSAETNLRLALCFVPEDAKTRRRSSGSSRRVNGHDALASPDVS